MSCIYCIGAVWCVVLVRAIFGHLFCKPTGVRMVSPSSSGGLKDAKSTTSALRRTRVVMDRNLTRLDAAMSQLSQDGETHQ